MLSKLYVRNFALIDEVEILPDRGFNILTGETGAGKSLLLGALALILGKRADYSMIFRPENKCIVEAVFAGLAPTLLEELKSYEDFDLEGDQVIIRREVKASGTSRAFINDTPVSLQVLREVASLLVDLHGQHENQMLLSPAQQIRLLDQYAATKNEVAEFGLSLQKLNRLEKELHEVEEKERLARQQIDYLKFQLEELENAKLDPENEESLEGEINLLQNAEEIQESLSQASDALYHNEDSLYSRLSEVTNNLQKAARMDPLLGEQHEKLNEALYTMQDVAYELSRFGDKVDLDPERLSELQSKQDINNRLKLKFSVRTLAELVDIRDDFASRVKEFESAGDQIDHLRKEREKLQKNLVNSGLELEKKRKSVLKSLSAKVNQILQDVGLQGAEFELKISRNVSESGQLEVENQKLKAGPAGFNLVEMLIRTNPGMPMGPLAQVASGGEVSRVMLAIKAALADKADLSVLIFDEIDTGISGETANRVAKVMKELAGRFQIIAITHLPQIAGRGNRHFLIFKENEAGTTVSRIRQLDEEGRVLELAKMLSGADPSPSAIKNAKELIGGH